MLAFLLALTTAFAGTCPAPAVYTTSDGIDLAPTGATSLTLNGLAFAAPVVTRLDPRSGCPLEITTDGLELRGIDPDEIDVAIAEALDGVSPDVLARGVTVELTDLDPALPNGGLVLGIQGIDPDEIDHALRSGVELFLDDGALEQTATVSLVRSGRVVGTAPATTGWVPTRAVLYSEGTAAETVHLYLKVTWALDTVVVDSVLAPGTTTAAIAIPSFMRMTRRVAAVEPSAP